MSDGRQVRRAIISETACWTKLSVLINGKCVAWEEKRVSLTISVLLDGIKEVIHL